jgi:uncharacterized protein YegL
MKTIFALIFTFSIGSLYSQYGVSSGSVSMTRSNGFESRNVNGFLPERSIIVEDFMNFHKHQINIPTKIKTQLTIDYNNEVLENKNQYLVQVGLATQNIGKLDEKNKVNVGLVIDRSGSMSGQNKLEKVKTALKKFVEGLNEGDFISIIVFDDQAEKVLNAQPITKDKSLIFNTINQIYSGGSTNIDSGLQLGYQEVMKNHNQNINSKVILLTDGMTNSGETNQEIIIKKSKKFNEKGIDISTIGVGSSLDFDLLKKLSDAGRGSNHFIGENEEDIQKVFIDELQSLVYQIAKKPVVEVEFPSDYKIITCYGYQPEFNQNKVSFKVENLGYGVTQIFLFKVEKTSKSTGNIKATITYKLSNGIEKTQVEQKNHNLESKFTQKEVVKNYQIALMAESLKNASVEYAKSNFGNAKKLMQETLSYINLNADLKDKDIERIYSIAKKYDHVVFQYAVK